MIKTLDDFCLNIESASQSYLPKDAKEGRFVIQPQCIENGLINFDLARIISETDYIAMKERCKPKQWDVLISNRGSNCGMPYLEFNEITGYATQSFTCLRCRNILDSKWLYLFLKSKKGQEELQKIKIGSIIPYIKVTSLKKMPITIPEYSPKFEEFVNTLINLELLIHNSINKANKQKELFDCLLNQYIK